MEIGLDSKMLDVNAAKKDSILERLNKRNKDRQNHIDVKLEQRNKENLDLEGADYFSQSFGERVREIETNIANVADSVNVPEPAEKGELLRVFAGITVEIHELQRYLSNSTIFLADYKIKACQNILNDLTARCEETRLRLMPKKKFGFNSKKVAPKVKVNPKLISADSVDFSEKSSITSSVFTWTLSNRKDEFIRLTNEEVNRQDITISDLSNCLVEIQGHAGSVQILNAVDCTFLCGPIARSMFVENCHNSTLVLACQQLRLHSSIACKIFLHVTCRAIIEDCRQIEISGYTYDYDDINGDFKKAGLDRSINNYKDVADFNWLSPDIPSPNWKLLPTAVSSPDWSEVRQKFKDTISSS